MAGSMNRIHDMPPGVIEDLDERYPVGVLGQDAGGWGYITMGPDQGSSVAVKLSVCCSETRETVKKRVNYAFFVKLIEIN